MKRNKINRDFDKETERYGYLLNKILYQIRRHGLEYLDKTRREVEGFGVSSSDSYPISAYVRDRKLNAGRTDIQYMIEHIRLSTIEKWRKALHIAVKDHEIDNQLREMKRDYDNIIRNAHFMSCTGICYGCPFSGPFYKNICEMLRCKH